MTISVDQEPDRIIYSIGTKCLAHLAPGQPHSCPVETYGFQRRRARVGKFIEIKAENLELAREFILQLL